MIRKRVILPVCAWSALVLGCADGSQLQAPQTSPREVSARAVAQDGVDQESRLDPATVSLVDSIARDLAGELKHTAKRRELVSALARSTTDDEHKLSLRSAVIAVRSNATRAIAVLSSDGAVRRNGEGGTSPAPQGGPAQTLDEIEAYFPVREQREKYDGADDMLVAYIVAEGEAPIAYSSRGERVLLSADRPPAQPVLMLVRRESDLTQHVLPSGCRNEKRSQDAIGTWKCGPAGVSAGAFTRSLNFVQESSLTFEEQCEYILHPDCPGNTPPPFIPGDGLYITRSQLTSLHEPWPLGDPEIVYRTYTSPILDRPYAEPVSCVSEQPFPNSTHAFDQNQLDYSSNPWAIGAGRVVSANQINQVANFSAFHPLIIEVYENDTGEFCTIDKVDFIAVATNAFTTGQALFNSARSLMTCRATEQALQTAIGAVVTVKAFKAVLGACAVWKTATAVSAFAQALSGSDDYIGTVVPVSDPSTNNGFSHAITSNGGIAGRVNMVTINN